MGAPAADCWPGFRGDGTSHTTARNLPLHWSAKDNIAWKAQLPGYGQSSPVVWRDRVFVTAVAGPNKEKGVVLAFVIKVGPHFVKVASNRLWSDTDLQASRAADAKQSAHQAPPRPGATEPPGADAFGEVVYGVAAVNNSFFLRTGTELSCIRQGQSP